MRKRPMVLLSAVALTSVLMANPAAARFDDDGGGGDAPASSPAPDGGSSCDPAYTWCSGSTVTPDSTVPPTTEPQEDPWANEPAVTDPASDPTPWFEPDPAPVVEPDPTPWFEPDPAPVVEPDPAPVTDPAPTPWFEPDPATPVTEPSSTVPSCDWRTEPCPDPGVDTPPSPPVSVPPDAVPPVTEPVPSPEPPPADPVPAPDPVPPVVDEPPTPAPDPVSVTDPPLPTCDPELDLCEDPGTQPLDPCAPAADDSVQIFPMGIVVTPVDPCPDPPCAPAVESSPPNWLDFILRPQGIVAVPIDPCAPDTCPTAPPVFDLMSFGVRNTEGPTICAGPQPPKIWCKQGRTYDDPYVKELCGRNNIVWVRSQATEANVERLSEPVEGGHVWFDVTLSGNSSVDGALQAFIAKYFVGVDVHATGDGSISGSFKGQICWRGTKYTKTFDRTIVYTVHYVTGYEETKRQKDRLVDVSYSPMKAYAC